MDLKSIENNMQPDIDAVTTWCDDIYAEWFSSYFNSSRILFDRLKSKDKPISDEELSWILIQLPLQLFSASEALSKFRISQEVIKLKTKEIEMSIKGTAGTLQTIDNKILIMAYAGIISRVESEISFSRELIMGAKKVWDSRRSTEGVHPVGEVDGNPPIILPEYKTLPKDYIKGSA